MSNSFSRIVPALVALIAFSGCTGFKGSFLRSSLHASRFANQQNASPAVNGCDGGLFFNGACAPIQSMDISSNVFGADHTMLWTFPLPPGNVGYVGLNGTISITQDQDLNFSEQLAEVGWADTCPSGATDMGNKSVTDYATGVRFLQAFIIKTNSNGTVSLPINFTLPVPVKMSGCFFITAGSDTWTRPGGTRANIQMNNDLQLNYINVTDTNENDYAVLDEGQGVGGEECVGNSDGPCNHSNPNQTNTYRYVYQFPTTQTLVSLSGSIANAPFAGDGRWPTVSVNWSARDIYFIDPQCSHTPSTAPGHIANGNPTAGATVLMDKTVEGSGPDQVRNYPVDVYVGLVVNAGDCLVHTFTQTSDGVMDMESQTAALVQPIQQSAGNSTSTNTSLAAAPASGPVDTSGNALASGATYAIRNVGSGECLDVVDNGLDNGNLIQQWNCSRAAANQSWTVTFYSDGSFSLNSSGSGKGLDFDSNTLPNNGTKVQQWDYAGTANQMFSLSESASGGYQIASLAATGQCLDVTGGSVDAGTRLQTYDCTGASNQAFVFVRR